VLLGCSLAASAAAFALAAWPRRTRRRQSRARLAGSRPVSCRFRAWPRRPWWSPPRSAGAGFRLLAGLAVGAVAAAAIATGIFSLFGGQHPAALTDNLARRLLASRRRVPWPG